MTPNSADPAPEREKRFRLKAKPDCISVVGGYSLDLYCANEACDRRAKPNNLPYSWPQGFFGNTHRDTMRKAKRYGWKIRGRIAFCPDCVKKSAKEPTR